MNLLKDKLIVIAGGSLGIGFVVAQKCAEAQARVIITSRTERDLRSAVEKLNAIPNEDHCYKVLDVSDREQVRKFARSIEEEFGRVDGLVNCAGIYGPIGRFDEIDIDHFVETIHTNFLGTAFMCHFLTPIIRNGGRIINYAGGGAASPFPNYSAYASSKIAIVRLTENLASEYQPLGITVNAIAPGFVVTRIHEDTIKAGSRAGEAFLEYSRNQIAKGGTPPEVPGDLTVFLLSDASDGLTGKFISAPWDAWSNSDFIQKLKDEKNFATLRRIDERTFFELKK